MSAQSSSVLAVVLVRDQPQLLQECLDSLSNQTVKPDQVVLLDLRPSAEQFPLAEAAALGLEVSTVIATGRSERDELVELLTQGGAAGFDFFWLLSEDSLPAPNSLSLMRAEFELSPSLAQVAPKLLHRDQTRRILRLGLTASSFGAVLERHADEYDQGQYDSDSDVLAAHAVGSMFRTADWLATDAGSQRLDSLYSSVAVSMQLRSAGKRVSVAPRAWISGIRQEVSVFDSLRVEFALRLTLSNRVLRWIWVLLLPLEGTVRAVQQVFLKQARAVLPTLGFAPWFWFTLPLRLGELQQVFASSSGTQNNIKSLLANRSELKLRRSTSRSEVVELNPVAAQPGFIESGAFWFTLLPLTLSLPMLPLGIHAAGLGLAPLSPTIAELFDSYQLNPGAAWLLPLLALLALIPGEPSAGFAWLIFLTPAIAFVSSWQLFRSIVGVRAVALISALVYSLNPMLLNARITAEPIAAIAAALLPWVLLAFLRVSQSSFATRRWRWAAVAGLLLAMSAALTPLTLPLAALFGLALIISRKLGWHWWLISVIPAIALLLPRAVNYQNDPATFFAGWEALTSSAQPASDIWSSWQTNGLTSGLLGLSAVTLLCVVANVLQPNPKSLSILGLALATLSTQLLLDGVSSWANIAGFLLLLIALQTNLDQARERIMTIGNFSLIAVLLLAVPVFLQPISLEWRSDSRVAPAIVHAAAALNPAVLTLVLDTSDTTIESQLQIGNGTHLDQQRSGADAYAASQPKALNPLEEAQLSAALAAGSTQQADELLTKGRISFVLLRGDDVEVRTNLESSGLLESAGVTEWGRLWRVRDAVENSAQAVPSNILVTANLALLAIYALLAAPTPGTFRRRGSDASIFVEGDEQL